MKKLKLAIVYLVCSLLIVSCGKEAINEIEDDFQMEPIHEEVDQTSLSSIQKENMEKMNANIKPTEIIGIVES